MGLARYLVDFLLRTPLGARGELPRFAV